MFFGISDNYGDSDPFLPIVLRTLQKNKKVEKEKETTERESLKATLVDELKSIISSQMVIAPEKRLQRAGAKVASATLDDDKGVAERCASALLQKFADMGAKAPGKSG